jgi:hypothetical protein
MTTGPIGTQLADPRIPSKHDCLLRITAELTEKSHSGRV